MPGYRPRRLLAAALVAEPRGEPPRERAPLRAPRRRRAAGGPRGEPPGAPRLPLAQKRFSGKLSPRQNATSLLVLIA